MDSIWTTVMKTFHNRFQRPQKSQVLADTPYDKFQERFKASRRYKVYESGQGIYQVEIPDSGRKFIVNLCQRLCDCKNFFEFQGPCAHAIIACRYDGEDPFDYFGAFYTLEVYRKTYRRSITPISIENLAADSFIQPPKLVKKRGRPKATRIRRKTKGKRKCGKCGELGHNTRSCIEANRSGRGERARQWRQEQEDWELDIMTESIEQEVEAQVRREAGGDSDHSSDSDSEISQLRSSDFEGIEL